jgi:hypothetical protein
MIYRFQIDLKGPIASLVLLLLTVGIYAPVPPNHTQEMKSVILEIGLEKKWDPKTTWIAYSMFYMQKKTKHITLPYLPTNQHLMTKFVHDKQRNEGQAEAYKTENSVLNSVLEHQQPSTLMPSKLMPPLTT